MAGDIWVMVRMHDGKVDRAARGTLAIASAMAARTGGQVAAWVFGAEGEARAAASEDFGGHAPHRLYLCPLGAGEDGPAGLSDALLGRRAAAAMLSRTEIAEVRAVLVPEGQLALDAAAGLVAALGGALVAHCRAVEWSGQEWLYLVPAFGGLAAIACPGAGPQVVSLVAGAKLAGEQAVGRGKAPEVVGIEPPPPPGLDPVALPRAAAPTPEAGALESASLVVAGGMGAGDADGWRVISDFASSIGAALGATRPAVDEGWAPAEAMIGQSGKRVEPNVLISVGISGDLQHLIGVGEGTTVIAVNSDPAAPIFGRADYGVVGDFRRFLPAISGRARSGVSGKQP
ncbi:MAG: electron transfer flavoprotein subunit alpha/FixB family protein [Bacillota bacterium]